MRSVWLAIFYKPSETILSIVKENPNKGLFRLCAIFGFAHLLQIAQLYAFSEKFSLMFILLFTIILSPIWGYLIFALSSFLIYFTGKWIQGKALYKECRAAMAWSSMPMLFNDLGWIAMIILFGKELFSRFPAGEFLTPSQISLLFVLLILQVAAVIWSLVIYLNALSAVQRFSTIRAILNVILSTVIIMALMFLLYFMFVFFWVVI